MLYTDESYRNYMIRGGGGSVYKVALNKGEKLVLSIPIEYKENIDIKILDTPLLYKLPVSRNKNYEIVNNTNQDVIIYNDNCFKAVNDYGLDLIQHNNLGEMIWYKKIVKIMKFLFVEMKKLE